MRRRNLDRLTLEEQQALADLAESYAFNLLLDAIQADIDDLADEIASARSDEEERRAVSEWRAMRQILFRLKSIPSAARDMLDPEEVRKSEEMPLSSDEMARIGRDFSGNPDVS